MSSYAGLGFIGADPYRVEQLGAALLSGAELLDDLRSRMTGLLYHSTWEGRDAVEARDEWSSSYAPALGITAEMLRHMSQVAYTNALQQSDASHHDASPHGHADSAHSGGHGGGIFDFLPWAHLGIDLTELAHHFVPLELPAFLKLVGKTLPFIGLGISAVEFFHYISIGDSGGAVLSAASFALGGVAAAAAVGLITLSAPVVVILGVAAVGLAAASLCPPVKRWVGDRWDDAMEFGGDVLEFSGGVVSGIAADAGAAWNATAEFTGNVVEDVVDGAQNLASGAVNFGQSVYDFVF